MQRVYDFLKEAGTYFIATVEGDQPRIRPFGTVDIYNGKLGIQTGKKKAFFKQVEANPKVESTCSKATMSSEACTPPETATASFCTSSPARRP